MSVIRLCLKYNIPDYSNKVPHGDWIDWLYANCPDISERTATRYMWIAKNEPKLKKAADENGQALADLSVAAATRLIAKPVTPKEKPKQAIAKTPASADPVMVLKHLAPDELFGLLKQTYDKEQLEQLTELLEAHLEPEEVAA